MIYVYKLQGDNLRPLTSVTCPRRVLAMSMDASANRYAIAALLDGRMGIWCNLQLSGDMGEESGSKRRKSSIPAETASTSTANNTTEESNHGHGPYPMFESVGVRTNFEAINLEDVADHGRHWINQTWNLMLRGAPKIAENKINAQSATFQGIPVESGPSTIYRHLCSDDDPPRSVSICPQRRAVAFGCSAGIELHWIDILTGQSLNRWFPLTAPSDFIYFLPQPPGLESAKKLRLISSAAHPKDRPNISRKFFSAKPTLSLFWGPCGIEAFHSMTSSLHCDHYRAIPLSDGHHMLFTDPSSGNLFLGCDAPLGGPTKLLRKILLAPPEPGKLPRLYTTAADLSWGARIVAVYGDAIVLYNIPPDVFAFSHEEQKIEGWDADTSPHLLLKDAEQDNWMNWLDNDPELFDSHIPGWPVTINCTIIGTLEGTCELAILTHPDITVWAFALDGRSKTWQLRKDAESVVLSKRFITHEGHVKEKFPFDGAPGTIVATDSALAPSQDTSDDERSVGYDGCVSMDIGRRSSRALHIDEDAGIDWLVFRGCDAWFDMEGDVVMFGTDEAIWGI
ncbi:hypothetical protein GQ43DRAFT_445548 [Delitschia confertaspora ATCC 74209]|uniref:Uncharacterized protein n=1 Tax=Delitschia confertaspora ATCC 74209 TaxID=1513339 RepID=A0A9P4N079_9PLEO|nr:hypothetical protein GQ43DRAFT_445548 [Delitschia confertaspora ATCC 74209]